MTAEGELSCLVYVSSATRLLGEKELLELLEGARRRNHAAGITGMLLYHEGNFMQVIEGPEGAVKVLESRVARDERHHGMITVYRAAVKERSFGDWSMAFRALDRAEAERIEGFQALGDGSFLESRFRERPTLVLQLLQKFARTTGRSGYM